jgi:hypothetical protein
MMGLALVLRVKLPESRPARAPRNFDLLASSARLARDEPALRRHALYGGLTFASFMTFWSTYAIHLSQAFGFGAGIAGLFGIVGIAGAGAASIAGRQIDQGRFGFICGSAAIFMMAGFGALLAGASRSVARFANRARSRAWRPRAHARTDLPMTADR